ncbi:bifunctional UDP-sugar hydrolase/5'-nucleotidase [Cohnella sp.]|uniref:bifunctional metallophosphatase/5'-nucleotidase n=1 Tax=Cohnella sp. TaxID=1883426 RepID=UPI003565A6B4
MTESNITLTLLHTNDLHSHFEEVSRIASYIAEVRASQPKDRIILLDCGDFLDRVRLETEGTLGASNRAVLESIGYDAVLLGNNEGLSYTPEELDELFQGMPIPVVCANMVLKETGKSPSWMIPTLTIERSGIRIGLIGLTAPFNDYYELLGWNAFDPLETMRKEVKRLRNEVDVLIVLSHLGLRQDERIAATVEGIDLILGGHTHHLLEVPLIIGQTALCAAGKFGNHIGHLELAFDSERKLIKISGGAIPTDDFPSHPELDTLIADYRLQAKRKMDKQVASLAEPLEWLPDSESPLSTLLACAVRRKTEAEIGIVNAGQLLQGLQSGVVTEELIHAICPSPINLCVMKLQGCQIVQALEESLLPEFHELVIRGFGFRGQVLGTLCLDGMEITIDLSAAPYHRIKHAKINGISLDENRVYSVGTLDMFAFGVGYVGLKEGYDIRYFLPEFIRDVLSEALNQEEWVEDCRRPRIHIQSK